MNTDCEFDIVESDQNAQFSEGRGGHGKLPICIEIPKIENPRKSDLWELTKNKTDFFENAKFHAIKQIGNFPFPK